MSRRLADDEFDATLRDFLAWRSGRVSGAPDAALVAAAMLDRSAGRSRRPTAISSAWLMFVVLIALVVVLLGAALVGRRLVIDAPLPFVSPMSIGASEDPCCQFGLALDQDRRIVVGELSDRRLRLTRLDATGRLETSAGAAVIEGPWLRSVVSLALQPDGRVVVLRRAGTSVFELARYHSNGSLDGSFGLAGNVSFDFSVPPRVSGPQSFASQVLIAPDGGVVVVGTTDDRLPVLRTPEPNTMVADWSPEDRKFAIARFLPDGAVDRGFGRNGLVLVNVARGQDSAFAAAIGSDGRIVVVGQTGYMTPGPGDNNLVAIRLMGDGSTDRSFGLASIHVEGTVNSSAGGVALGPDGSVVVIGRGMSPNAVARYASDGSIDGSLAGDGTLESTDAGKLIDVVVQDDGKIVLVGMDRTIGRLHPDGSEDATFGVAGFVKVP